MSRRDGTVDSSVRGFPRVSGDEPIIMQKRWNGVQFSPRERG